MRAHIIENGIVVNTIEVESLDFMPGLVEATAGSIGWRYEGGEFFPPSRWSDVETGRVELRDQINVKRDQLETQGFPHAGLWFQSDERSVARLNSTALTASAALLGGQNPPFPDWLAADNTPLPVDAQGVLALQASLTQHAGLLHQCARSLKLLVEAAETVADLEAIDINKGWPV